APAPGAPPFRVDRPAARGGGEPGPWVARQPLPGPGGQRGGVGVLDALLGQVEVARDARRRGEHEGPLATVRVRDRGGYRARLNTGPGARPGPAGPGASRPERPT